MSFTNLNLLKRLHLPQRSFFFALLVATVWSCSKDHEEAPTVDPKTEDPTVVEPTNVAPVIANQNFEANEDIEAGSTIGTIVASDAEGDDLNFSITTNSDGLFTLSADGTLSLASGRTLDFENTESHNIVVSVTDGSLTTTATITIHVNDIFEALGLVLEFSISQANTTIVIPIGFTDYTYDFDVHWGDDTMDTGYTANASHTYASPGTYTVSIEGELPHLMLKDTNPITRNSLSKVLQWGNMEWKNMTGMFQGVETFEIVASDTPDLTQVTSMYGMFYGCTHFNSDISNWDVSTITNMGNLFSGVKYFNQDLNSWDVSNVTSLQYTFQNTNDFGNHIKDWDVSSVERFYATFEGSEFNGDISAWDVSSAITMHRMFSGNKLFNQDISGWDISQVTDLRETFDGATSFNQNLGSWAIGRVLTMQNMLNYTAMSTENYMKTLKGWQDYPSTPSNLRVGVYQLKYCNATNGARTYLSNVKGWEFLGDTEDCTGS
ncbi:BspA family leucine-rich repeat surface protein [Sediminicola luteus]|uniref:Cadherin domain-containing protein n=1 Tax=Sediminicola luteus TaxID=319238 RepID=A0A2A4G7A5_9FLAO|nr:BspA family leucine-rich repeat surface protein [Sediminicola luteus]PCE63834.1 hypothetical protein B7P33_11225 [Sediminicola luteus]